MQIFRSRRRVGRHDRLGSTSREPHDHLVSQRLEIKARADLEVERAEPAGGHEVPAERGAGGRELDRDVGVRGPVGLRPQVRTAQGVAAEPLGGRRIALADHHRRERARDARAQIRVVGALGRQGEDAGDPQERRSRVTLRAKSMASRQALVYCWCSGNGF